MNKQIKVKLLQATPLTVAMRAIRTCWDSHDKCDSTTNYPDIYSDKYGEDVELETENLNDFIEGRTKLSNTNNLQPAFYHSSLGEKDKELIERVGNKNKHSSTLEHIVFTFDISGISRACLMELTRHRMSSFSVKSTRYTLKEMKDVDFGFKVENGKVVDVYTSVLNHYYNLAPVFTYGREGVLKIAENAYLIQNLLREGTSLDELKYMLNESYRTSLVWTINLRSLQNFLKLRTSRSALREIRDLAYTIYSALPYDYKYLLEDYLEDKDHKLLKQPLFLKGVHNEALGKGTIELIGNENKEALDNLVNDLRDAIIIESPIESFEIDSSKTRETIETYVKEKLGNRYGPEAFTIETHIAVILGGGKKGLDIKLKLFYRGKDLDKDITLYYN